MLKQFKNQLRSYVNRPDLPGHSPYFVGQVLRDIQDAPDLETIRALIDDYSGGQTDAILESVYDSVIESAFDAWYEEYSDELTTGESVDYGGILWYSEGWNPIHALDKIIQSAKEFNLEDRVDSYWTERGYEPGENGFSDEYTTCGNCGRIVRTQADSYGWEPRYLTTEWGDLLCENCVDPSDLNQYVNQNEKAIPDFMEKLAAKNGWEKCEHEFENGMHRGQDDSPAKVAEVLTRAGIDYIFWYDASQFYVTFGVYVHASNLDDTNKLLDNFDAYQGYSNAEELSQALRGIPQEHWKVTRTTWQNGEFTSESW